jgi:urease subunit gamma
MELTPREKDKLLLFTAGLLAERRKNKGLEFNYLVAVAFISWPCWKGRERAGASLSSWTMAVHF